jgi:chromosome segregation ATPase
MKTIKDQRIIKTVKQYNDKDPYIVPNELHSILATEVRKLPAELEIYYQKYFNDRDKVVNLSESYEEAFNEIEDKVAAYDAELKVLKRQIEALQRTLELEQKQLASSKLSLDTYYEQKKYDQYNNLVPDYNALVREHNANVVVIQQKIDRYNTVVKLRNNLATQQNQLYKAIDSRPEKVKTR